MGKKKRLNRFITKWIKSDLPDDRSTVLLLGVTRIPSTPTAARRPCSLPLNSTNFPQNNPIVQHKSRRNSISSRKDCLIRRNSFSTPKRHFEQNCTKPGSSFHVKPSDVRKRVNFGSQDSSSSELESSGGNSTPCNSDKQCSTDTTPTNTTSSDLTPYPTMDRSVDSIGACSLDADASVDLSEWSEQSSVGTLRSVSITTPEPQPHLPSYLSLACTVSGYSTTTNYDPERLSKSRDASPHRLHDDLTPFTPPNRNSPNYSIRNNLLSPPNLVPLPNQKYLTSDSPQNNHNMEEQILTRHKFYSSTTTTTISSKESKKYIKNIYSSDSIDGCVSNGHPNGVSSKCINFESETASFMGGKTMSDEFTNGMQHKSFIQQRVERLYGPGALAQGFFINMQRKNRSFEVGKEKSFKAAPENNNHSKSFNENFLEVNTSESYLKQSTSTPTLPVLRHLRPEFRAQLPILSPKRSYDNVLAKSFTIPILKEESKINGHANNSKPVEEVILNGNQNVIAKDEVSKDGHYFIQILENEIKRLLILADAVEIDLLDEHLPEETKGKLRSASGKARLLTSQKMQQFKGLCTKNINQKDGEAFPTTNEDLQGFWDMVLLQVEQVDAIFKEIEVLRANGWKEIFVEKAKSNGNVNKPRKILTNRAKPATNQVNEEARKEREIKRKQMLEERRKAMRSQKQNAKENIEIFVPESS